MALTIKGLGVHNWQNQLYPCFDLLKGHKFWLVTIFNHYFPYGINVPYEDLKEIIKYMVLWIGNIYSELISLKESYYV
jgi:hypothetical protein